MKMFYIKKNYKGEATLSELEVIECEKTYKIVRNNTDVCRCLLRKCEEGKFCVSTLGLPFVFAKTKEEAIQLWNDGVEQMFQEELPKIRDRINLLGGLSIGLPKKSVTLESLKSIICSLLK